MGNQYDSDYYERGIETGKSNYQNYHWLPDLTIPMAMSIIDFLKIEPGATILDYGCAKGYLVKALRMLRRKAWGTDISEYALSQSDPDIRPFLISASYVLRLWKEEKYYYKYGICKDVLEHIKEKDLVELLMVMRIRRLLTVVPLGENGKYIAEANSRDITHIICEGRKWWEDLFEKCGWICEFSSTRLEGIKDSYSSIPNSHLFMVHRRV